MQLNDKRVVEGAGYINLGKIHSSYVSLGSIVIEMGMGYDILVGDDELEKLINLLERLETIKEGKLKE